MKYSRFKWSHYLQIARINRWPLNLFVLPGFFCAVILTPHYQYLFAPMLIVGLLSVCLTASANYTINEYFDRHSDALHPEKNKRAGAKGLLNPYYVFIQYLILLLAAFLLAWQVNIYFTYTIIAFMVMGIIYNVPPIRSKDYAYLDILSESINNPLRFLCGWFIIQHVGVAPTSIVVSYWMGGAFLMTVKRYAELRHIDNHKLVSQYRPSFKYYSEKKLLLLAIFFAVCSSFFLAIFLIKYRIELLLSFPFFALLFTWYANIGMKENSPAQHPENLFKKEPRFILYVLFLIILVLFLFFVRMPFLDFLLK